MTCLAGIWGAGQVWQGPWQRVQWLTLTLGSNPFKAGLHTALLSKHTRWRPPCVWVCSLVQLLKCQQQHDRQFKLAGWCSGRTKPPMHVPQMARVPEMYCPCCSSTLHAAHLAYGVNVVRLIRHHHGIAHQACHALVVLNLQQPAIHRAAPIKQAAWHNTWQHVYACATSSLAVQLTICPAFKYQEVASYTAEKVSWHAYACKHHEQ